MKRIVGIDFGHARIGIAITDPMQIIATPKGRLDVKGLSDVEKAKQLVEYLRPYENEIESIVIGLPLERSGQEGVMAKSVRNFAVQLEKIISFPILFFDERLTSKQALRELKSQGLKRKKAAFLEDQTAACLILQNFLQSVCT